MRKLLGCGFVGVFLILAALFAYQWSRITASGIGTGRIAGRSDDLPPRRPRVSNELNGAALVQIARTPAQFEGKTMTIKGRVRGPLPLASNRTVYRLVDSSGEYSLLVVDDREMPKEYWARSVTGQVRLLKAPAGNAQYPYMVSLKDDVRYDLKWDEVKSFFTDKLKDIERGAKEMGRNAAR